MSSWSRIRSHLALRGLLIACLALATVATYFVGAAQARVALPQQGDPHSPWLFVQNQGQYNEQARFLLLNGRGSTWLADDAMWLTLWEGPVEGGEAERDDGDPPERLRGVNLRLSWVGAETQPALEPALRQATHVSYLLGSDPDQWHADVPVWGSVRYQELYPEIDLVLGGSGAGEDGFVPWGLEAGAGADLAGVQLRIEGAEQVTVAGDALLVSTSIGQVRLPLPSVDAPGNRSADSFLADTPSPSVRRTGPGTFVLAAPFRRVEAPAGGGPADQPEDLLYSAFLGGASYETGYAAAVDTSGAAYVTGTTPSTDFPTVPGSFDTVMDYQDAFLVKVDPTGGSLVYATFLGGTLAESGYGLALSGNVATVVGQTTSGDFPTTPGAYDTTCGSDGLCDDWSDAYLVKVNATGTDLLYGTYLGGSDLESSLAVSVEGGIAYVTGETYSDDLPTTGGAYDTTCGTDGHCNPYQGDPLKDGFLLIVNPAGGGEADLLYGTYLGGSDEDAGHGVAAVGGQAYVTGFTWSDDFLEDPLAGNADVFAVKIDPAGGGAGDLVYGTLVGGSGTDVGDAIAVSGGQAYLTGETRSADFPASGAYGGGFNDAFVARLDAGGTLSYALFLGGADRDQGRALIVNSSGQVVLAGDSRSSDFPTTLDSYDPSINGGRDVVVVRLDLAEPDPIIYSSFLGGTLDDIGYGLAVDGLGCAYLTGDTRSYTDFPTTPDSFDPDFNGGIRDAFVSKLRVGPSGSVAIEKRTNGQDADAPPGPYLLVGDAVNWTYVVTNTGDVDLSSVGTVDDQGVLVECPTDVLVPGEEMVCTANGTAAEGQYANIGTASGTPPIGPVVTSEDLSHYFGAIPGIDLEKHTNGEDADATPGPYIPVGDPVTWEYQVTNTGNVALTEVTISDNVLGQVCTLPALGVGQTETCTVLGTAEVGQYENLGAASGTPPVGPDVSDEDLSHYFGALTTLDLEKHTNGQDADATPGPYVPVGDAVLWEYVVTNTGNVDLTDVTVTDDLLGPVCTLPVLGIGQTETCTMNGTSEPGQYANLGLATGTPPGGLPDAGDSDPSHYYGAAPSLDLEKHTNGQDADDTPGPYIPVGDAVLWEYAVTNTGNVELTGVTVNDDVLGPVCTIDTLAPGATETCTANSTAEEGQYANLGTATGTPPGSLPDVSDTDPSHYFGSAPAIDLEKHTNGADADSAPGPYIPVGDAVLWEYTVSNTGNVELTDVTVSDDMLGLVCTLPTLGVGQTETCTANGTAEAGQYANLGTATGTPPVGPDVVDTDFSHYFGAVPGIDLEKHTNGQDADSTPGPYIPVGDAVLWEYAVTNTGNVDLTDVTVGDDVLGPVCTLPTLGVGQTETCTANGTAEAGQYANLGSASGTPPGGLPDVSDEDQSHYFGALTSLDLEKHTNGQDADAAPGPYIPVGDPVTWEYTVTNGGNVDLTDVAITDSVLGSICVIPTLAAGDSDSCNQAGTASAGQYENLGTAVGSPPGGLPDVSDEDLSHYFGALTGISLIKTTNGEDANSPPGPEVPVGELVTWEYAVTNEGNVPLSNVTITDDPLGPICVIPSLAAGASDSCSTDGTATLGQYSNQGMVTATPPGGLPDVADSDPSHYFGVLLDIDLEKATNGEDADLPPGPYILPGDPVVWTYSVANTGNVELSGITVVDDNGTPGDPADDYTCVIGTLPPGGVDDTTCIQNGTAEAGAYANLAEAEGTYGGWMVTDTDPSHYLGVVPGLDLEKLTAGQDADSPPGPYLLVGEAVTWVYSVANVGDLDIVDVLVEDDNGTPDEPDDDYTCTIDLIPQGEVDDTTCIQVGVVQPGQYENLASAEGQSGGFPVADLDPSHYFGVSASLDLEKHTNGQDADGTPGPYIPVGDAVHWEFAVTNTGNVDLTDVTITDDRLGLVCTLDVLGIGQTETCGADGTAEAGQYANLGTATGTPPGGLPDVSDTDPSHYFGSAPAIDLEKHTNGQDADDAPGAYVLTGDAVLWEYVVTNTGNVDLTDVAVSDDVLGPVCTLPTLGAGQTETCTANGTAQEGQYANLGTVTATPPVGPAVADTDASHYFGATTAIDLEKHTNGQDADDTPGPYIPVGEAVLWQYSVTNMSNVELTDVTVTDDVLGPVCTLPTLGVGQTETCPTDGVAEAGQYANLGTASGTPPGGLPDVVDTDASHYFGSAPGIDLEKHTNGQDGDDPPGIYILTGDAVLWEYAVTNTGNVTLLDVTISDDVLGPICNLPELGVGQSETCTANGTAAEGQYANLGTATGTPQVGPDVTDIDASHYFGASPGIHLEKYTNGQDADVPPGPYILVGDPVTWEYMVSNTGNVPLTDITVTDDQGVLISCPQSTLGPGEQMTCDAGEEAVPGQYANLGMVEGTPPAGPILVDEDASHYFGALLALDLEKLTNGVDADDPPGPAIEVGEPVTWTYQVTNEGNVTLTEVLVTDDQGVDVTCPDETLVPGEAMECTAHGIATDGLYENLGTATGHFGDSDVWDIDLSHYAGGGVVKRLYLPIAMR